MQCPLRKKKENSPAILSGSWYTRWDANFLRFVSITYGHEKGVFCVIYAFFITLEFTIYEPQKGTFSATLVAAICRHFPSLFYSLCSNLPAVNTSQEILVKNYKGLHQASQI